MAPAFQGSLSASNLPVYAHNQPEYQGYQHIVLRESTSAGYLSTSSNNTTPEVIFGILATVIGLGALCMTFFQLRRTRRVVLYEMAG